MLENNLLYTTVPNKFKATIFKHHQMYFEAFKIMPINNNDTKQQRLNLVSNFILFLRSNMMSLKFINIPHIGCWLLVFSHNLNSFGFINNHIPAECKNSLFAYPLKSINNLLNFLDNPSILDKTTDISKNSKGDGVVSTPGDYEAFYKVTYGKQGLAASYLAPLFNNHEKAVVFYSIQPSKPKGTESNSNSPKFNKILQLDQNMNNNSDVNKKVNITVLVHGSSKADLANNTKKLFKELPECNFYAANAQATKYDLTHYLLVNDAHNDVMDSYDVGGSYPFVTNGEDGINVKDLLKNDKGVEPKTRFTNNFGYGKHSANMSRANQAPETPAAAALVALGALGLTALVGYMLTQNENNNHKH